MRRPVSVVSLLCAVLGSIGLGSIGEAGGTPHAPTTASVTAVENLVRNGGFENPTITRPWKPFFASGQRRISGWQVLQHSVDLVSRLACGSGQPIGRG